MTQKEIIQMLEAGESMVKFFGISSNTYSIGDKKITERQFNAILKSYNNKLDFTGDFGGFTKHKYTLKKS